MAYLILKWLHILSATILFGTGIGSAFYLFMANRTRDVAAIAFAVRHVVLADWLFTTPAVILQLLTGLGLVHVTGYSLGDFWVVGGLGLYLFAGACWVPVVFMQIRMRRLADAALQSGTPLAADYWRLARRWVVLGALAFPAIVAVFYLMIFKPTL